MIVILRAAIVKKRSARKLRRRHEARSNDNCNCQLPLVYLINTIVVARSRKGFSASFERAIEIICDSLSVSSRRVYQNAYRAWREFSAAQGFAVIDVTFDNIRAFINHADVAKSTRQNR